MKKKSVLVSLAFCLYSAMNIAQTTFPLIGACTSACTGNLGENIFPNGDFGTGTPNVLATDPGFAPGYNYTTSPPPMDGFYTITNNTAPWGSFAATNWVSIKDNSPNPSGYMMVVNAAFSPGLFFEKQVPVCENTLYEFSGDFISMIKPSLASSHIQSDIAFRIDGINVCETGLIPHSGQWQTVRFSFVTAPGTTSVKLSMANNAPGGFGNDLAVDNISFKACGPRIELLDTVYYCLGQAVEIQPLLTQSPYNTPFYQWQSSPLTSANWQNIPGATSENINLPNPDPSLRYRLIAANSASNLALPQCRALSFNVRLAVDDLSDFKISGADTIVCNGAPAILEAGTQTAYLWSDGSQGTTLTVGDPGWYSVDILSQRGCPATDSIFVYEIDLTAAATPANPVCTGESTGAILFSMIQGGVPPLYFGTNPIQEQSSGLLTGLGAGSYTAFVRDSLGCRFEVPLELKDPAPYMLDLGEDQTLPACDTVMLGAVWNYEPIRFEWSPAAGLSCTGCTFPQASSLLPVTYSLKVTDLRGCTAIDSVRLLYQPRIEVVSPNVFAPQGDDPSNAVFTIYPSKSAVSIKRLSIYDRWGSIVFDRSNLLLGDPALAWDGRNPSGKAEPAGVYVWIAEIEFTDGSVHVSKGDVTILR